jgi:hypothetical protein
MAELVRRVEAMGGAIPPADSPPPVEAPASAPAPAPAPPPPDAPTDRSDAIEVEPEPEPEPQPEPAPVPVVGGPTGEIWTGLLARVKARKVMLASFLGHGAPAAIEGETLTVAFDNNYYEGMVSRRENLAIIQEELAIIAGKNMTFHAKMGAVPERARPAGDDDQPANKSKDLLEENQGLRRIIHDLGGTLLPGGSS